MTQAATGVTGYGHENPWDGWVRLWLFGVAGLVFAMVIVGGATRLTDSGLSITEWKPILGALPPLTDADWHDAFTKYKQIPEYRHVNPNMTLEGFKFIFWWEWAHRFLGRVIGIAFALPLAFFWWKGALRAGMGGKLAGLFALGGLQGAIGWYMVSSGLVDRVDVSQYRLALHLSVAFLIYALLLWTAFSLGGERSRAMAIAPMPWQTRLAPLLVLLVFVQVFLGALVAGLKAGLAYNTWPAMDGALVPEGLFRMQPWWINVFENETLVQFNHRLAAYAVFALALTQVWVWRREERASVLRSSAALVGAGVLLQVVLGIATLLMAVPLWLGLLHQAGAAIVLGLALRHWYLVSNMR